MIKRETHILFFFANLTNQNLQQRMEKTAQSVWGNCLAFIKDNIQPQAYKTWFEPIVAVKLSNLSFKYSGPK